MSGDDSAAELRESGVALLRGAFAADVLTGFREAAVRCFEAVGAERPLPEHYRFNRFPHSVLLSALSDFGFDDPDSPDGPDELMAPLSAPGLGPLFSAALGSEWVCNLEHSWVRKKFAPLQAPAGEYHPQGWHQDGALGVQFPLEAGPALPMTELLTCWIPLNGCGVDSPGLEFVRCRQAGLLHFTELDDAALRQRFAAEEFWAPELEFGDVLVFLNSVLHRTYAREEMRRNRLSVEYRIFPC
jgi:Phytanoyl-CoA dioxygenase (PhyH)